MAIVKLHSCISKQLEKLNSIWYFLFLQEIVRRSGGSSEQTIRVVWERQITEGSNDQRATRNQFPQRKTEERYSGLQTKNGGKYRSFQTGQKRRQENEQGVEDPQEGREEEGCPDTVFGVGT